MNEPILLKYKSDTKQAQEKLSHDVRAALDDAEALIKAVATHAEEGVADLGARAKESLGRAHANQPHARNRRRESTGDRDSNRRLRA